VENNSPRNSQPETHRFEDDRRRGPKGWRPHRKDRLPHAGENSSEELPLSGLLLVLIPPAERQLCRGQVAERGRCSARTNTRQEDIMSRRHNVHVASWGAGSRILAARAGSPRAKILGHVPLAPRGVADCRWPETKGAATQGPPRREISTIDFQLSTVLSTCPPPMPPPGGPAWPPAPPFSSSSGSSLTSK